MALALEAVVALNHAQFGQGLSTMGALTANVAGAMAYAFGGVAGEIMTMTRAFGPMGTAIATLKQAVTVGEAFEFSMANVATVTNLSADALVEVSQKARDFASETSFTATEAAEALYALGSAGFGTAEQLNDMLSPALMLAGATQAEASITTETLTTALNAFRLETEDSTNVVNLFAGAIANSPANMERLSEAMAQAAPVAAGFKVSLEDTVESIAAFHRVGIMGSAAGTAFRQAMTKLVQEMGNADSVLGKALQGWTPSIEGLTGAIARMEKAGITGAQAMEELGIRGGKAVAAQLALGSDAIQELGDQIVKTGDVSAMYAKQMDTVHSQWKVFVSMMQEIGLKIWDQISDKVMATVEVLKSMAGWVDSLVSAFATGEGFEFIAEEFGKLFDKLAEVTSGTVLYDALKKILSGVATGLANLLESDFLDTVLTGLGKMVVSILRAVTQAVAGLIGSMTAETGNINSALISLLKGLQTSLNALLDGILTGLFGTSKWAEHIYRWYLGIKLAILENSGVIIGAISDVLIAAIKKVTDGVGGLAEKLGLDKLADNIKESGEGMAKSLSDNFGDAFRGPIEQTKSLIEGVNKSIADGEKAASSQSKVFSVQFPDALKTFGKSLVDAADDSKKGFGTITDAAGNVIASLSDINKGFGTITDAAGNVIASVGETPLTGMGAEDSLSAVLPDVEELSAGTFDQNLTSIAESLAILAKAEGVLWAAG